MLFSLSSLTTASLLKKDDGMTIQHYRMITRILVGGAVAFSVYVGGAAAASADPNSIGSAPSPFGGLTCNCQQTTPAGGPTVRQELDWGIQAGLSS